jgi:hypothetical protein
MQETGNRKKTRFILPPATCILYPAGLLQQSSPKETLHFETKIAHCFEFSV